MHLKFHVKVFLQPIKDILVTESLESRMKACAAIVLWIQEEGRSLLPQMAKEENLAKRQRDGEQQILVPLTADFLPDS